MEQAPEYRGEKVSVNRGLLLSMGEGAEVQISYRFLLCLWCLVRVQTGSRGAECALVESQKLLAGLDICKERDECAKSVNGGGERSCRGADELKCCVVFVVAGVRAGR